MSEEIVACPGCAKKFRIPEGAPPGSFACTACNADVPYGAPPAKAAVRAGARPAAAARPAPAQPTRPAAAAPARSTATAAPAASSRRAAPSRRSSRGDDDVEPKKTNPAILWSSIAGGVLLIVGVYFGTRPTPKPPAAPEVAAAKPAQPAKPAATQPATTTPQPAKPEPAPAAPVPAPAAKGPDIPVAVKPPASSGPDVKVTVPEARPAEADPGSAARANYAMLGQVVKSVPGTTDDERSDMDRLVALAMDFNAGKDGSNAEGKLIRVGKKAVPSILSAFSKQYSTTKWGTDMEQWGADKAQDLLHRIAGASGPQSEFWPKFSPGALTPPEDFEKAAKMWIDWWNVTGSALAKFKPRND